MKEFIKKNIKMIVIVLVVLLLTGIVAYATGTYVFESTDVRFDNTNTEITAGDVQGALEEVYHHVTDYNEIKDEIGNATMGTTATTITGAIAEHESDISSINDHIANKEANLLIGDRFLVEVDISASGDKHVDITYPSTPTGYTRIGCMAFSTTYRAYVKGIGGDRLYYYVTNPSAKSFFQAYPIYYKP